ncbi:hypothetical protein HYH03_012705 [Edaphochlamys debaryana]|uniref:PI3K/PI4K catalytic domain-containing protein n=1 Tax=Edaphochlamys debaryana TaxID=47281 RepID=A0A835XXK0_9CHLO|nr:hypothetical protein HYH03_012705 [Edaphochlamys debaryana]|eukprot:KAG2488705.1 hypothetical protein HYH03_012705 [Edaphochlamys debaryana]
MPHVTQCRVCHRCHLSETPPPLSSAAGLAGGSNLRTDGPTGSSAQLETTAGVDPAQRPDPASKVVKDLRPSDFGPRDPEASQGLPECAECYGCRQELTVLSGKARFGNHTYRVDLGASNGWIFATPSNLTRSGRALVKLHCLPLAKRPGLAAPSCAPALTYEAGVVTRVWAAPVRAVVPGVGYPIDWWALWMEEAEGVSLDQLLAARSPDPVPASAVAELLNTRLNRTAVLRGALYDLLTGQCDRHGGNVFVQEDGSITLIDNDQSMVYGSKLCAFDSILLPTSQKYAVVMFNNEFVMKLPGAQRDPAVLGDGVSAQVVLDFRCALQGPADARGGAAEAAGEQGRGGGSGGGPAAAGLPSELAVCLRRISGMTSAEVRAHYGFFDGDGAPDLRQRAKDLLEHGLEWTLLHGRPANPPGRNYRLQPPCCAVRPTGGIGYTCAHPWARTWDVPYGDPHRGWDWTGPEPDPGSYEGGKHNGTEGVEATATGGRVVTRGTSTRDMFKGSQGTASGVTAEGLEGEKPSKGVVATAAGVGGSRHSMGGSGGGGQSQRRRIRRRRSRRSAAEVKPPAP